MKRSVYFLVLIFIVVSCEKNVNLQQTDSGITKRDLSESEAILKENLQATAKLMTSVIQDKMVIDELKTISAEGREFYEISFKDLLSQQSVKGQSFKMLREKFLDACSSEAKGGEFDLAQYLIDNECYLYCPYPEVFYPKGIENFTVASHPIDNDADGPGFLIENGVMLEKTVNEEYSDDNPVLLIMPKDPDKEDIPDDKGTIPSGAKETVNEVRVGHVRCADYCGNLFEGTLELRIARGSPVFNPTTETATGTYGVVMTFDYPRDYAKAAIKNWNSYCNGGWFNVNIIWDSNWRPEKVTQAILAYEYDRQTTKETSANVGYKKDELSVTQTIKVTATYSGNFLGLAEWDRTWFFATNTVAGPYDEVKYGWVVRKLSQPFKLTTPSRTF